jgi:hypothetical protein
MKNTGQLRRQPQNSGPGRFTAKKALTGRRSDLARARAGPIAAKKVPGPVPDSTPGPGPGPVHRRFGGVWCGAWSRGDEAGHVGAAALEVQARKPLPDAVPALPTRAGRSGLARGLGGGAGGMTPP